MTKRIAIFLPSLIGGGAERSALFVAETLVDAGYRVEIVAATARGHLADHPFVRERLVDLGAFSALTGMAKYRRYLRRERPDLVISFVHSANLVSGLMATDVPFIVSVRNSIERDRRDQWWVRRWFGPGLERRLYARAALVHVISEEMGEQVRRLWAVPAERLWVTRSTAETAQAGRAPDPAAAEAIAAARPYLVSVGRLAPIKGFDTLIEAFARAALPPAMRLVIVGDGPERPALARQIERLGLVGRVLLPGFHDPVRPWLDGAAGFVFASRSEGMPRVVMEALAAGLPIAAMRCPGGLAELLGEGRFGRLVPLGDGDALAQAMADMADGTLAPPDPAALAEHLGHYGAESVGRSYVAMVEHVIGPPA